MPLRSLRSAAILRLVGGWRCCRGLSWGRKVSRLRFAKRFGGRLWVTWRLVVGEVVRAFFSLGAFSAARSRREPDCTILYSIHLYESFLSLMASLLFIIHMLLLSYSNCSLIPKSILCRVIEVSKTPPCLNCLRFSDLVKVRWFFTHWKAFKSDWSRASLPGLSFPKVETL